MTMGNIKPLTKSRYLQAVAYLCDMDKDLAGVVEKFGTPSLNRGKPGFETLIRLIIEQQVSVAAGRTIFAKLLAALPVLNAESILKASDTCLKQAGLSRQKLLYCRCLSEAIVSRSLNISTLAKQSDDEVRRRLMQIKGIGRWTADLYLLAGMKRPDVWPVGDLALDVSMQKLKRMRKPTPQRIDQLTARWRPWRSVAARIVWLHYSSAR